jgi:2-polyprenyl-6-methoxyphenol hydroxylase-like FAD-dependent oxidoreductase
MLFTQIGGSLSALMHGIMLHRLGHSVRIFERSSSGTPVSHMAGVCLGADVLRFLERFDGASEIPLGIESLQLQAVDHKGQVQPFLKARRVMSSWDALYFRLRANFDALASSYVPSPPSPAVYSGDGESTSAPSASYETGKEVIGISEIENADRVLVTYKDDSNAGRVERATADLVIGADGPNSVVRRTFLKTGGRDRKYAGYVAWRGVVPEDEVSSRTRDVFRTNITYSLLPSGGGHVIL